MDTIVEHVHISYTAHPNGIHEFIFKNPNRAAIDEYMVHLDFLMSTAPRHEVLRQLTDSSAGIASVAYAMQKGREIMRKYRNPPKMRTAILYADSLVLSLFSPSLRLLRATNFQSAFFKVEEREEAIRWLLNY